MEKIVPFDKIVERRVEVPVDRVVHVEKRVEVPVERIIEKRVEVPVERIVEKRIEVPVDRVVHVEKRVEIPVDRIVNVEKRIEVPVDRVVHVEKIVVDDKEINRLRREGEKSKKENKHLNLQINKYQTQINSMEDDMDCVQSAPPQLVHKKVEVEKIVEKLVPFDKIIEKRVEVEKVFILFLINILANIHRKDCRENSRSSCR